MAVQPCLNCGTPLPPGAACAVCLAIEQQTAGLGDQEREAAFARVRASAPVSPALDTVAVPPPSPSSEPPVFSELPPCPRCGAMGLAVDEPVCWKCQQLEHLYGADPEELERQLAKSRQDWAQARAETDARFAGKTDEQILAEDEAVERIRPQIRRPDALASGKHLWEMTENEQAEIRRWHLSRQYSLPTNVPPLAVERVIYNTTDLTAHEGALPGITIGFDQLGFWWGGNQPTSPGDLGRFPWSYVISMIVEGPETVEQRVTLPRAAALGIFSLGFKKRQPRSYLTLNTGVGGRVFEVKTTPVELRAHLLPVVEWLDQNSASIQLLANG